jgi:hypothetical protein
MSAATQSAAAVIDRRAIDRVAKLIEALRKAHGDAVTVAVMMLAVRYAHEAD